MYGYFRPYHSNLSQKERTLFNAHYCRICYCLRIAGGQMARFCTTYDGAVYSLILALQDKTDSPPYLPCERIGTSNMKKFQEDDRGLKLARLSLVSFGEKFRDDRLDGNVFKSYGAYWLFAKAINQAKAVEPELARNAFEQTERINKLQESGAPLPEIFGAYGDMAAGSFSQFLDMTPETEELIRSVSEYNFLVDMVVDYADDYKSGAYNGFKTEGLATFPEYFEQHYLEFSEIANAITERLFCAILAVRDDSVIWNTLFKIIMCSIDTILPSAILGKDVTFHYFRDLFTRIGANMKLKKDIKRLGIENEKD